MISFFISGNPTVDYMILDIEGAEFPVLKTIPWDKLDIRVLQVEMDLAGQVFDGTAEDIRKLLNDNGYVLYSRVMADEFFVKRDFLQELATN